MPPASHAAVPSSLSSTCAPAGARNASPRERWLVSAMRLAIEPLGVHSASAVPSSPATRASSSRRVGSPSSTSSPTSASAMAARICLVGRVTVSDRRSIGPSDARRARVEGRTAVDSTSRRRIGRAGVTERSRPCADRANPGAECNGARRLYRPRRKEGRGRARRGRVRAVLPRAPGRHPPHRLPDVRRLAPRGRPHPGRLRRAAPALAAGAGQGRARRVDAPHADARGGRRVAQAVAAGAVHRRRRGGRQGGRGPGRHDAARAGRRAALRCRRGSGPCWCCGTSMGWTSPRRLPRWGAARAR